MTLGRRRFLGILGGAAIGSAVAKPNVAWAVARSKWFGAPIADTGFSFRQTNFEVVDPRWQKQMVTYFSSEPPGTVVIDTQNRFLYWIWENNTALRYGVGVGKEGFSWHGHANIARKSLWPRWVPPPEMLERKPHLPSMVKGGDPENPLGPRALYLYRDRQDLGYRIHGTTAPWSIGTAASSGCIRMFNEDVIDLYQRCPVGTRVSVLPHLGASPEQMEASVQ